MGSQRYCNVWMVCGWPKNFASQLLSNLIALARLFFLLVAAQRLVLLKAICFLI